MGQISFTLTKGNICKCPQCGNNSKFVGKSQQVSEDCCEVWVECICGHTPAESWKDRIEDVWGSLDKGMLIAAMESTWNSLLEEKNEPVPVTA